MATKEQPQLKPISGWDSPITQAFQAVNPNTTGLALTQVLTPDQIAQQAKNQASLQYGAPGTDLAIRSQLLAAEGTPPEWKTSVSNPNNTASSIGEGISNGIQNFMSQRHYRQHQGELQQLGQQYSLGQQNQIQMAQQLMAQQAQQQQAALATQNAHDQGIYTQLSNTHPDLANAYMNSDRAGRDHILQTIGNANLTTAYAQPLAVAQEQATQAANTERINAANQGPPVYDQTTGVTNPAGVDAFKIRTGTTPTTFVQVAGEQNQLQGQNIQNAMAKIQLGAAPQKTQQDLAHGALQVTADEIANQKAGVEARFATAHNQLALDTGNLANQKTAADANKLNNGWHVYQQLEQSGRLDSTDPTTQAENAALLGAYKIPWKAPAGSKVQVVKTSGGKSILYNAETDQYATIGANGSTGGWQSLKRPH